MDKTNFDLWLNKRQNVINEGIFDKLFGKKPQQAPAPTGPTKPSEIYSNPEVQQYTNELLHLWGITAGLEMINGKGQVTGQLSSIPSGIHQALIRFVAGHVIGGGDKTSFLWVSFHDAAQIVDWLDSLRRPGHKQSVADEFHIEDPKSLAMWVQTKLPMSSNARYQNNFATNSDQYGNNRKSRKASRPSLMEYPELMEVVKAMHHFLQEVNKRKDIRRVNNGLHGPLVHLVDAFKKAFPHDPSIAAMGVQAIDTSIIDPTDPTGGGDRAGTARTRA